MKRYFILTLLFCCNILQGFAFDYTDENGVTWSCETNYGYNATLTGASNYGSEVIVPEKVYDGETAYTVNYLCSTFKDSKIITKVTLPKASLTIDGAFSQCNNLSEVVNSQYIVKCTMGAFEYTNLTSIDLSSCEFVGGFDSSKNLKTVILKVCETVEQRAFVNCTSLQTLGETTNITKVGAKAFYGCTSLTNIDLSNCTIFESNYSQGIFSGCTNLNKVILSKSLTDIPSYLFLGCTGLTSFDFSNITSVGESAFEDTGLTSVALPTTVKEIAANTFKDCSNLKNVNLGCITSIGESAFEFCYALESIEFPETLISIGDLAFEGTNLKEVVLPSSISFIGREAFYNVNYITINAIKVPTLSGDFGKNSIVLVPTESLNSYKTTETWKDFAGQIFTIGAKLDYEVKTTAAANAPGLLQQLDRNNLNSIVTLKVSGTINSYDIMLFRNKMDNLHHLDLSEADIVANPYEYYEGCCTQDSILGDNAFSNLDKIISVKLPNSVKHINAAFNNCKHLRNVTLPEKLETLSGSFYSCELLQEVVFKSCKKIGDGTFRYCTSLNNVFIPEGVEEIGTFAFISCTSLDNISLPKGVKKIGYQALSNCKFSKIVLPEGLEVIEYAGFYGSPYLKKVEFPSTLKRIESNAFQKCTSLDSISLPALSYIGRNAFNGCANLKELRVPSTLEKIEDGAFSGCNLEKVYAYTVLPINISQNTFDNFSNIALYVPTQSVDNYYLNTQWSQF